MLNRGESRAVLLRACGKGNKETREIWLERALASIPPHSRILDAGAGELQYKKFCKHLDYVSQDFGQYDGAGDEAGLQTGSWDQSQIDILSDITAIPEPAASFDAVMCIEVFEHLPSPIEAIREFARLLRPGGTLLVTAPFCSLTHFAPFHFYTGYNRYFFEKWLPECGFAIDEIVPNGNFFEFVGQELRRVNAMSDKYAVSAPKASMAKRKIRSLALKLLLAWLEELSASDSGSHELLCFGYHVQARRR